MSSSARADQDDRGASHVAEFQFLDLRGTTEPISSIPETPVVINRGHFRREKPAAVFGVSRVQSRATYRACHRVRDAVRQSRMAGKEARLPPDRRCGKQ